MNEIGLALVETDDGVAIYQTPKFSALEAGTEVYVEGFTPSGKARGKVLAYTDIEKNSEQYVFISILSIEGYGIGGYGTNNGLFRRVLSTIRENPMEWEE